jgi:hypothetical protein
VKYFLANEKRVARWVTSGGPVHYEMLPG